MSAAWQGRRVLVTGHTGFKGAWLSMLLLHRGATVHGISLPAEAGALFETALLQELVTSVTCDLRDPSRLCEEVKRADPEVVFHLAAQPLVLRSYADPQESWATNVMGTLHLLEALRALDRPLTLVVTTTDKVYAGAPEAGAFRESDRLGGHDPYSASKAACEILLQSHRASFLDEAGIRLGVARAGNVIGGGDWARDRILPDLVRARLAGRPLELRHPEAVRPWQHVLDPLNGYISMAERLDKGEALPAALNFGPDPEDERTVAELVSEAERCWPPDHGSPPSPVAAHPGQREAARLALSTDLVRRSLGWRPKWGFAQSVEQTMQWYRGVCEGASARAVTEAQIALFEAA